MATEPGPIRRFSEEQTDAILRRAAELQATGAQTSAADRGLTIPEMERLARGAGLDPALVRRAADEVGTSGRTASRALGAPVRLVLERVIEGELEEAAWEAMVGEIQQTIGSPGYPSRVGRTRTWSVTTPTSQQGIRVVSITATMQHGQTVIRADESLHHLVGALFGGIGGGLGGGGMGVGFGVGLGVFQSLPAALAIVVACLGGSYVLARTLFVRSARRRAAELSGLLDRLVALAGPGAES
jgi:hypothetical protein